MCCEGTYEKQIAMKTHVLRQAYGNPTQHLVLLWNLWKTKRKHRFCVGTNRKRKGNVGFAWEPMENVMKTYVFRGS